MTLTTLRLGRALVVATAWLAACGGQSLDSEQPDAPCHSDAECGPGQACVPLDPAEQRPQPGLDPCGRYQRCGGDTACGTDQVCAPAWQSLGVNGACDALICSAPCTEGSCPSDSTCNTGTGVCEVIRCAGDTPGSCPDHWRCDPEAAATEPPYSVSGSEVLDLAFVERAIERGCVRRRCNEAGGFVCSSTWECAPDQAEDGSGCIPVACEAGGHCSDDATLICLSASSYPRPGALGDAQGCVTRNCAEGGAPCSLVTEAGNRVDTCSPTAPGADTYTGCVILPCTDSADCFGGYVCGPSAPGSDERGCHFPNTTPPVDPPPVDPPPVDPPAGEPSSPGRCVARSG